MEAMRPEEVREFLAHNKFGTLGLADGGRAYTLPIFYGFDGRSLYFLTREGLKSEYLRGTEEACFTVVRATTLDDWASVQVFGTVEEVVHEPDQLAAMDALMSVPLPPEWGLSEFGEPRRSARAAHMLRMTPSRMSGRYSVRPEAVSETASRGM